MELADTNINVHIVCPGPVKSNIAAYAITEEKDKVIIHYCTVVFLSQII